MQNEAAEARKTREALDAQSALDATVSSSDAHDIVEAEDSWSYETPRPWLSIEEAALMLGRSSRGVERSIIGRWGNKLPEGWQARRVRIDGVDEWRVVPPPGFRIKHSKKVDAATKEEFTHYQAQQAEFDEREILEKTFAAAENQIFNGELESDANNNSPGGNPGGDYLNEENTVPTDLKEPARDTEKETSGGFSFEKLLQSAGQLAQKELASLGLNVKNQLIHESQSYANNLDVEHTIVIDRSDEVEKLLRELANVQRDLAEERRQHMEDMRLIHDLQNNMRLLEVNSTHTAELKDDLRLAQQLLSEHKKQYKAYLALPWWKKIFRTQP